MRRGSRIALLAVLPLLLTTATAQASLKERPYSIHLIIGGVQPALNDSAQVWLFTPVYGGELQYMISPQTGFLLSFRQSIIKNDSVSTSIFKFRQKRANRKWVVTDFSLGPKFYLDKRKGITAFIFTKLDLLFWSVKALPDDRELMVENASGRLVKYSATELGFTGGFGFEKIFADRVGVSISSEFTYLTGVGTDFSRSVKNSRSRALLQFGGSLSLHFGTKRKSLRDKFKEEGKAASTPQARKVYEGVVDAETGDTVFADKSRSDTTKPFVPLSPPKAIDEEDSDRDGVKDKFDKCPNTPQGALVDLDGCPHDADGDGVLDGIDGCPDTPRDARAYLDPAGCPRDSDLDRIPDYLDRCPNTPPSVKTDSVGCPLDGDYDGVNDELDPCPDTPRGVPVDASGCPDMETIFYRRVITTLFRAGETRLAAKSNATLDSVAVLMRMFPEVTAVISGYTDDLGPADANLQVSQKRADAVRQYLIAKGIGARRLKAVGRGESNFVASNRTKTGREKNRRTEVEFDYSTGIR